MSVNGLIIASGFSGRMKRLKPILDCGGISFIIGILLKTSLVCNKVIVVLGHEHELIKRHLKESPDLLLKNNSKIRDFLISALDRTTIVFNENYHLGMFTSLQKGIENSSGSDWTIYHFVDQPTLPVKFYFDFVNQIQPGFDWIQPKFNRRAGHPLLLSKSFYKNILSCDKSHNLKNLSNEIKLNKKLWDCNYPESLDDIDTEDDYNKLIYPELNLINELEQWIK